jgi:hypothetical protein
VHLVDPANPQDLQQIHALQDALTASQQSPGTFEIPNWDDASLKKVHAALLQLGETISRHKAHVRHPQASG